MSGTGVLVVCATPIGNLGDVTLRVLEALQEADVIEAEDTRVTRKLLARHDIRTALEPFHAHNAAKQTPQVLARIASGERVALVSDAGTPGISDPGAQLVDAALEEGLTVEVLPGPSAIITALVASGLPTHAFYFGGFLPRKPGPRARALAALSGLDATLVFYESPRRAASTLQAMAAVLPGRRAAMARELTKVHEEVVRDEVGALAELMEGRELKGEIVILVGPPAGRQGQATDSTVEARLEELLGAGLSVRDAVRYASEELGLPRNEVYRVATRSEPDGGA